MIKIIQVGCSGTLNYGDEISHINVRKIIRKLLPNTYITQFGHKSFILDDFHNDIDNYEIFSNIETCKKLIQECDFWILGPGTVLPFDDKPLFIEFNKLNKNVIIWGVGCGGTIPDKLYNYVSNSIFSSCRDKTSLQHVLKVKPDAFLIPDPMFLTSIVTENKKINGITMSCNLELNKNYSKKFKENIYNIISQTMKKIGGKWIAIPATISKNLSVPSSGYSDNDNKCHYKLQKYFPELEICEFENFDQITDKIIHLDTYISSRLHTGVVAVGSGVSTVYFGHEKMGWMVNSWNIPAIYSGVYETLSINKLMDCYDYSKKTINRENIHNFNKNIINDFGVEMIKEKLLNFVNK